jgi:hypothetical protein
VFNVPCFSVVVVTETGLEGGVLPPPLQPATNIVINTASKQTKPNERTLILATFSLIFQFESFCLVKRRRRRIGIMQGKKIFAALRQRFI